MQIAIKIVDRALRGMYCRGADICSKCWPLMQIAIKIVDGALRGMYCRGADICDITACYIFSAGQPQFLGSTEQSEGVC